MAKWKVNDWVLVKGTNKKFKFHIIEVISQESSGGKHIGYVGRLFRNDGQEEFLAPGSGRQMFNEIELEDSEKGDRPAKN